VALVPGTRIGPYEILAAVGAGGMGEVYRARDTKLQRDVAIKILSGTFAGDLDRIERFSREAQLLASLNHPNIAHIHGFDDTTTPALVMEFIDGPTLADRIAKGAIPLDEALPIASQIAEALEAAHDHGVIHRDLKPANIKVRPDGAVKVLDFGLAKAFEPAGSVAGNATMSPTLSLHATQAGLILGTAAYMPPEQAKGRPVDRRADLWSFGCVLYEMLTGRQPFVGETISDVLAKVIERDPDWSALPPTTPNSVRTLLRRCFEKDRRRRLDSAAMARIEIDEASRPQPREEHAAVAINSRKTRRGWPAWAAVALALTIGSAAVIATWAATRRPVTVPSPLARFAIALPTGEPLAFSINDRDLAIAPDGSRIAYAAGAQAQLMVRALDQLDATPLPGVTNARAPFFSADGRWICFFDRLDEGVTTGPTGQRGALKKVSTSGGPPITIASLTGASRGASWGPDDTIVFATSDPATGILRVRAAGGESEVLTTPDAAQGERDHYFPSMLPGGRGLLFTIATKAGSFHYQVAVRDLQTGQQRTLIQSGSHAEYVDTGHLVYADGGALWAVPFDPVAMEVRGDPVPLPEQVLTLGAANFTVSKSGTLVYMPVNASEARSLVWVTREGREEPTGAPPRGYATARIAPDGTRAVLQITEGKSDVWTWDFTRQVMVRLTVGPNRFFAPIWAKDGGAVFYGSVIPTAEGWNLYRRSADGAGAASALTTGPGQKRINTVSPDGTHLVFEEETAAGDYDLMLLSLEGTPRVEPLLNTPFDERNAAVSPDGRWMAYESNESSQSQIYVRPFPNVGDGGPYQISTSGGRTPLWSPTGHDLFFVNGSSVMAANVQVSPTFNAGSPVKLFDAPWLLLDGRFANSGTNRTYDVSPDGRRFLMIKLNAADGGASRMILVQNWFEELKAKAPPRK
jgi:serine/threonine-protein kinase